MGKVFVKVLLLLISLTEVFPMKSIDLDEVIPQVILHIKSPVNIEDECNFWVAVDEDVAYNTSANLVGISVGALGLELLNGAIVEITPYSRDDIKGDSCVWKGSTQFNSNRISEECKSNYAMRIKLKGDWIGSKANLLLSLYYNANENASNACPVGTSLCRCSTYDDSSSEETKTSERCIPDDLFCNGVPNCGMCDYDESEEVGCKSDNSDSCIWTKFEYLAMMAMTALLLLLIPVLFLFTILYHRRRRDSSRTTHSFPPGFDRNNNRSSVDGRYPHVISTLPVHIDPPPNYDDLPEEVKVYPKSLENPSNEDNN